MIFYFETLLTFTTVGLPDKCFNLVLINVLHISYFDILFCSIYMVEFTSSHFLRYSIKNLSGAKVSTITSVSNPIVNTVESILVKLYKWPLIFEGPWLSALPASFPLPLRFEPLLL